jgi:sec-independent protein translocase protein TatB
VFDIGFSELVIISLIALIAIGPKRLPTVARTLGHLAGRLRRYVDDVKADISREAELEDLRKMRDDMQQAATSFESSVQTEINKTEADLNSAAQAATGEAPKGADDAAGAAAEPSKLAEPPKLSEKAG